VAEHPPWTLKSVPPHVREKLLRYAKMANLTAAEWLEKATDTEAARQDGDRVLPPVRHGQTEAVPQADLAVLAQSLRAMAEAAVAISSVSKGAARDVAALVRDQARSARGVAPVGPRRLSGQTIAHGATEYETSAYEGLPGRPT
jgi:hypothetical protein